MLKQTNNIKIEKQTRFMFFQSPLCVYIGCILMGFFKCITNHSYPAMLFFFFFVKLEALNSTICDLFYGRLQNGRY